MGYRLLLDENVEREVGRRLDGDGHDVEHVAALADLETGVDDSTLASYASETRRVILTYDDDFVVDIPEDRHDGVLYVGDDTIPPASVADAVTAISEVYPQAELRGVEFVGENWS